MLGINSSELLVLLVVALVVIGPKQVVQLLQQVHHFIDQLQHFSAQARRNIDQNLRQNQLLREEYRDFGKEVASVPQQISQIGMQAKKDIADIRASTSALTQGSSERTSNGIDSSLDPSLSSSHIVDSLWGYNPRTHMQQTIQNEISAWIRLRNTYEDIQIGKNSLTSGE